MSELYERPLSVGLNLFSFVKDAGGSGRYARELIPAMLRVEPETRIAALVSSEVPRDVYREPWAGTVDWIELPLKVTHGPPGNFALNMAAQWGLLPALALRRRLDVVHGLANIVPPIAPGVATVVTLLDLIWIRHPETMSRRATVGMKLVAPTSARFADRVIAISRDARRDIVATLGIDEARVDVTHLGVSLDETVRPLGEAEVRGRFDLGARPVVLSVAAKRAHKNLSALVRALPALSDLDPVLVLPGSPTPHEQELRALAEELEVGNRVRFLHWVAEEELEALYRVASCFALPSFEEGFGLPVLEAMRREVPVACSNTTSLPEVVDEAALLFDPRDQASIDAALRRLLTDRDLAGELVRRGLDRCRAFPWEATARETLATYRRALADPRWKRLSRRRARRRRG